MPIERIEGGGTVITGENSINYARLVTMRAALKLEVNTGLKMSRGRSALSVVKAELGFKGTKQRVLEQLNEYIAKTYPTPESAQ